MSWGFIATWPSFAIGMLLLYWVIVAIVVIADEREPTETLAWLLVLFAFPLIGLLFYFLFGRNWKKKARRSKWAAEIVRLGTPTMNRVNEKYADAEAEALAWAEPKGLSPVIKTIVATDKAHPLPAYDVTILRDGEVKFAALKEDLASAKDTINIQYFIWERDKLTAELKEILLDRLKAGVEVRMLNDLAGCLAYKKDEIKELRAAGARILYDMTDWRKLNYRNHRKIVVIDSVLGYVGGLNVGQEYIDGKPKYDSWRDTHSKFHGPAVADLQKLFAARWHDKTGENLFTERFFPREYPEDGRRTLAQTVAQGVELWWDPGRRAHMAGMAAANERIWIQSPYLIPTPDIYAVMLDQALAGKDVRFMMTGVPDKMMAWRAAESFFAPMIEAGIKIYRYDAGFFHSKTMTIDQSVCVIGTMNMDIRSLALHKEVMTWYYDEEIARQHDEIFLDDMKRCSEVTLETVYEWSASHRLRNSVSRLLSNVM